MLESMRTLRKEKGLTMKALGEIVGVAEATISTYEVGRSEPSLTVLCAIADALDCSLDLLVRGKEKDHSEEWSRKELLKRLQGYDLGALRDLMTLAEFLEHRKAQERSSGQE